MITDAGKLIDSLFAKVFSENHEALIVQNITVYIRASISLHHQLGLRLLSRFHFSWEAS